MKIIWCMVPEIWSMTDRIFCHFCHHKWQSRCMVPVIWRATDIIFRHFGPFFCPFTPLIGWKIKILRKIKKPWRYHLTHVYHISLFLRYGARQTEFFWSFWAIFCLTPLITQKIKILKKWKMEVSFYTSVAKIVIICYTVPETWRLTDVNFIFHFGLFFYPFTPLTTRKIKVSKKQKKNLEISFYMFSQKIMITWCMFHEIWCVTDGQMDKRTVVQKKWHVEVGAPPNNRNKSHNLFWVPKAVISLSFVSIWPFDTTVN